MEASVAQSILFFLAVVACSPNRIIIEKSEKDSGGKEIEKSLPYLPSIPKKDSDEKMQSVETEKLFSEKASLTGVLLRSPGNDATVDGFARLQHTKSIAVTQTMTEAEGRQFYFTGLLPQAQNKSEFTKAVKEGEVPRYGWAQCAVTTSSVLEHAAIKSGVTKLAPIFSRERREHSSDPLSCTDEVEVELRRLGWFYYFKDKWKAPPGAIGLEKGRYNKCGTPDHSGHIYTILEDRGAAANDFIADNGGYGHVYKAATGGFWLPPGVYPLLR